MPAMRVATILPIPFLGVERDAGYHMCLAHLMHIPEYGNFFRQVADNGQFVLMDNGVVETGEPLPFNELLHIARMHNVTQMTLPDKIRDSKATLDLHHDAIRRTKGRHPSLMAIPQGKDLSCWRKCAREMAERADGWGVRAIGITKFLEGMVTKRSDAVLSVPEIMDSGLDIHLLGTMGDDPTEIYHSAQALRGHVRGADSGMAAIWTQAGLVVGDAPRPRIELDFMEDGIPDGYNQELLVLNRRKWLRAVQGGHL